MLLGRLRIRGKLALLVLIPLLTVAGLTVPLVLNRADVAGRAADTARAVRVASQVGSLIQDLQQERLLAVGRVLSVVDRNRVVLQTTAVKDRITDLRANLGADLPAKTDAAISSETNLSGIRLAVLGGNAIVDSVLNGFDAVITRLIDSLGLLDQVDVATSEGRQVVALDAVLRLDERISAGAAQLAQMVAERRASSLTRYVANLAALQTEATRFGTYATPEQTALYQLVQLALNQRLGNFPTEIEANPLQALAKFKIAQLFPSLESFIVLGRFVERKIVLDVTAEVTARQRAVLTTAYFVIGLALLVFIVVVLMSLAVARAVARPLTRLTASAERVATVADAELRRVADDDADSAEPIRLEKVDVRATDEIGELARAFDRVQTTAARLVERQVASRRNVALMFGHVGRRTQNLVGRQLALIDRLEQQEVNPQRLQELYRLDHVSNRLRRSAGSLVVLSGAAGGEEHTSPLSLADAVRLALGEIEDYTRVDVQIPPGPALAPAIVADLVLVLAELMENATAFSPPHSRVTVSSIPTDHGERLTVVDHGLGLSPERMAEENTRLARRERLDLAPTEVLGLFVVGRLARKHGLGVALAPTPGGGVTAIIDVGAELLVPVGHGPADGGRALVQGQNQRPAFDRAVARAVDVVADAPVPLNVVALNRASRTIGAARSWNAFAPPQRRPAATPPALPSSQPSSESPSEPAAQPPRPSLPAAAPRPVPPAAPQVPPPSIGWAAPAPVPAPAGTPPRPLLRQRVPGAQLPAGASPEPAPPPRPVDPLTDPMAEPAQARASVEEFEAGVRRAEQLAAELSAAGLAGTAPAPGSGSPEQRLPSALTRRVPGATLPRSVPPERTGPPAPQRVAPDPEAARDLLEQFESGVIRALREVGSDRRVTGSGYSQEEGTAR